MTIESFAKIKRKHLVQEQLPAFVSENHNTFVKFLQTYYEFLSEKQFVTSERLIDYLDTDNVPEEFLTHFWEEIKEIPGNIIVDKRLLANHIRDLYASKGTRKSIELLFRILYNEDISIYEPKDDVLRASDGKWDDKKIIRTRVPKDFDLTSLNGKKLYQYNQFLIELCQFIVADVKVFHTDDTYLYVEITPSTLVGTVFPELLLFNSTRTVSLEIVQSFAIDQYQKRGSLYKSGDIFYSGTLPCYVETVGTGPVDRIAIIDGGSGYAVGDFLTIDESGSGGAGLSVVVQSVGGSGDVRSLSIVNHGKGYEDLPKIVGNGTGKFVAYSSTIGKILKVSVKEPTSDNSPLNLTTRAIVSNTTGLSQGEPLFLYENRVKTEFGMSILLESGEAILSEQAVTPSFIGNLNLIESSNVITLKNNFGTGHMLAQDGSSAILMESGQGISTETETIDLDSYTVIGGTSNVVFSIIYTNPAKISTKLQPIFGVSASYRNEDGFVGYPTKRVEDSLFYQDFSYVIRSSQSFENYKNILYKMIHPAGMAVFGEVNINTYVSTVTGRIKQAFNDFRTITESLISLVKTPIEYRLRVKIEPHLILGTTYEFLEKYKFLLGDNYSTATYGVSGNLGGKKFNRVAKSDVKNWKISDFKNIRLTDIYEYDADYFTTTPLILDGSWQLDGSQTLSGIKPPTTMSSVGKYRLRSQKRCLYTHGAEVTISPAYPIEDAVVVTDSLSYVLNAVVRDGITPTDLLIKQATFVFNLSDTISISDTSVGMYTFNKSVSDTTTVSDSQVMTFNKYQIDTVSIVDQISRLDMNAPKDSTNVSDVVTWVLSSAVSINTNSLNSGTI